MKTVLVFFESRDRALDALRSLNVTQYPAGGFRFADVRYTPDHRLAILTALDGVEFHVPTSQLLLVRVEEVAP